MSDRTSQHFIVTIDSTLDAERTKELLNKLLNAGMTDVELVHQGGGSGTGEFSAADASDLLDQILFLPELVSVPATGPDESPEISIIPLPCGRLLTWEESGANGPWWALKTANGERVRWLNEHEVDFVVSTARAAQALRDRTSHGDTPSPPGLAL